MVNDNQALGLIFSRRSIRNFTTEEVSAAEIQALLEAGMAAPSARDRRPWEFVVVTDAGIREQLAQTHQFSGVARKAPLVIVVCGHQEVAPHWVQDCSAATENILLAAVGLGLGAVWVGIHPAIVRESHVRQILGLPLGVRPLCLIPIGHPDEEKQARTRFEAAHVHYERFGQQDPPGAD